MRLAAFNGSPRAGGNTESLLKEAVRGAKAAGGRVEIFNLPVMTIKGCRDCGECAEGGPCVIKDDMRRIYPVIREFERFILASPVYFQGVSAQAKAMIDRCQSFWYEKYRLKKPIPAGAHGRKGLFLAVGGRIDKDGLLCAQKTATAFFRTISVPRHAELGYLGINAKGDILKRPDALKEAYEAGMKLIK